MKFDLKNQVVVITGGAGLLGFRYAKAIADEGADMIMLFADNLISILVAGLPEVESCM